jgi:hypothetical protein
MNTILKIFHKWWDFEKNQSIPDDILKVSESNWITKFYFNNEYIPTKKEKEKELLYIECDCELKMKNSERNYTINNTIYEYKNFRVNKVIHWDIKFYYVEQI